MSEVESKLASLFEEFARDVGFSGEGAYGFASRQLNVPNTLDTGDLTSLPPLLDNRND